MRRWAGLAGLVALGMVLTGALYGWVLWKVYPTMGGDEPHYVLAAGSMVEDGDVDLRNDYDDVTRWGRVYPNHPRLEVHVSAFDYKGDGTLRPVHNVGLPVLLLLSQSIRPGFRTAQAQMVGISVLTMGALLALLLRLARRWWAAVLVWLPVALTMPMLSFSNQVYPEMPAALVILLVIHLLLWRRLLWVAGLLASTLPWLHVRYWILVPALLGFVLWRAGSWRGWAAAVAPTLVMAAVMAVFFQRWYGGWLPSAPYDVGPYRGAGKISGVSLYQYGLGSLWSPVFGLIPYAPLFWLGVAGVGAAVARWGRVAAAGALGAGLYVVGVAVAGGAAFSLPARFLIPIVPLLALPLLAFVELGVAAWGGFVVLALANAALAWQVPTRYGDLYSLGVARYPLVVKSEQLYPVFIEDVGLVTFDYPNEAFQPRGPGVVHLFLGLRAGPWEIKPSTTRPVLIELVQVVGGQRVLASATVPPGGVLRYQSPNTRAVELRVHDPEIQAVGGALVGPGAAKVEQYADWPKALGWVVVTMGLGAVAYRRGRSEAVST